MYLAGGVLFLSTNPTDDEDWIGSSSFRRPPGMSGSWWGCGRSPHRRLGLLECLQSVVKTPGLNRSRKCWRRSVRIVCWFHSRIGRRHKCWRFPWGKRGVSWGSRNIRRWFRWIYREFRNTKKAPTTCNHAVRPPFGIDAAASGGGFFSVTRLELWISKEAAARSLSISALEFIMMRTTEDREKTKRFTNLNKKYFRHTTIDWYYRTPWHLNLCGSNRRVITIRMPDEVLEVTTSR